ncbi:MAG: RsiV family protein, partial [Lysobacter sp.]
SYTGGVHGAPLIARFVWLPQRNRLLTAHELIPDAKSWKPIAVNVREQLHTALSQRVDADALPPGERAEVVKNASRMIDDGTEPNPESFAMFEPVVAPSGKLRALRFVFAPYQVGPYSDGTQTVEVPAAVLLPHIAPAYRDLFEVDAA